MCHSTAKAETLSIGTTSTRLVGPSMHRKKLILTVHSPIITDLASTNPFVNPAPINIVLTPAAGERVHLHGFTLNATANYTGTITVKDGATTVGNYNVNYVAGANDVQFMFADEGIVGGVNNAITITGPSAAAAATVTVNVIAHSHPEENSRVTISPESTVTLDKGLTLNAGIDPLVLDATDVGDWLSRDLFAVANVALTISIVDVAEIGKPQGSPHHEHYMDPKEMDKRNPKGY